MIKKECHFYYVMGRLCELIEPAVPQYLYMKLPTTHRICFTSVTCIYGLANRSGNPVPYTVYTYMCILAGNSYTNSTVITFC